MTDGAPTPLNSPTMIVVDDSPASGRSWSLVGSRAGMLSPREEGLEVGELGPPAGDATAALPGGLYHKVRVRRNLAMSSQG